jgi:ketosteroid isomerase-like protein
MLWLTVLLWIGADPAPVPCPGSAAADPVVAVAREILEADNRRALDEVLAFYSEGAVLWPPKESPVRGIAEIRKRYEAIFSDWSPSLATSIESVCVGDQVAVLRGRVSGTLRPRAGGADRPVADAYLMVLSRQGGRWRIRDLAWR